MSSNLAFKGILSNTRIMFGLLPGLGAMIVLRMAIHLYRPDIEDADNRVRDHPLDKLYDCYDFIIVGAGSAGSVLANRLSENPDWNILLLEAGQDENVLSEVPVLFPILQTSSIDWQFVTEPSENYCLSMTDHRCKWPRGKVLGGSSVLNAMLYIRGNKLDYDYWEQMGNAGWSYKDVLPYFLKSEDMRIPEFQNNPYHSTGGPLTVEHFRYQQPITNVILEAGEQLGYKILDVNGEYQTGFTRSHATVRDGLRCSTAKGFLRPAGKKPNLHVSVHSLVEKILIDEHKKAYGIKFSKHGYQRIVKASKEVILSAGAIQSPQLLMLSGIGDAEHLKEHGIYPISNLSGVGKNLQDHVAMGGNSFLFDNPNENGTEYCFNLKSAMTIPTLIDFCIHKEGIMYSMMEAEAMAFVNTKYQNSEEDYPDIQLFIAPTADNLDGGLFGKRANGLTDESYAELYESILYDSSFSIIPLLLRPKSRGYLKLKDANPFSPPLIYPNYYSEPEDIKVMVEGARVIKALVDQPALQALKARPNPNRNPGCVHHELMSDEHLECQARHHTLTIYHPVGTCAMGPPTDLNAVVDDRLRVYGIKSLRVIDGSIMPSIVSGNTNAPIIMIAEKASDMIKEDWAESLQNVDSTCGPNYRANHIADGKNRDSVDENDTNKSADDSPSKIQLLHPDFFNETISLLSNLPAKASNNKEFVDSKKNQVSNDVKEKSKVEETLKSLPRNPYHSQIPGQQNNEIHMKTEKSSNTYTVPYPYLPINIFQGQLGNPTVANQVSNVNPFGMPTYAQNIANWPFYNPVQSNTNYVQPTFYAQNNRINSLQSGYNYNPINQAPEDPYYQIQDKVNPEGKKTCKVWLYYDGIKYEVLV